MCFCMIVMMLIIIFVVHIFVACIQELRSCMFLHLMYDHR